MTAHIAARHRKSSHIRDVRRLRTLRVPEAVEMVVRSLAATADTNAHKLARGQKKALHDTRVAIRRIRTILRAYRDSLPTALQAERMNLSQLMRGTNTHRDLEVHEEMLTHILTRKRLESQTRQAVTKLRKRMRRQLESIRAADQRTARAFMSGTRSLVRCFDQRLVALNERLYSVTTASIVQRETNTVVTLCEGLGRKRQVKRMHRARLSAKRLRYVVEPLPDRIIGIRDGIARLKRVQTLLGNIRDTQTLRASVTAECSPAEPTIDEMDVRSVLAIVQADEDRLFASLLRRRARGEITRLADRLGRVVQHLLR